MRRIRLHTKFIVLLIGVSLVPLIIVAGVTLVRFQQTLKTDADKLGHQLAATAAADIKTFMVSQLGVLDNIAALYHPDFPIEAGVADRLTEVILLRSENFMDISVVDANGDELVHKNRLLVIAENDLANVSEKDPFRIVKEQGVYVGPTYVRSGRNFFDLGRQILDSKGAFAGAVFAQVDARVMATVLEKVSQIAGEGGRVFIVNDHGGVVAHPNNSYVLGEKDLSNLPPVASIVSNYSVELSASYKNELDQQVFGTAHPLTIELPELRSSVPPRINWYVVAEQKESLVYGEANAAATYSVIISLLAVLAAILAAVFFAGRIAKPILALHTAALEFGRGNLSYRAHVSSGDEIGDLADSFNTTAGKLEETVRSLQKEEEIVAAERNKLQVILSGITNAVVAVDLDRTIVLFNKAAEKLVGRTAQTVIGKPITDIITLFDKKDAIAIDTYCPVETGVTDGPVFAADDLRLTDAAGQEHIVNLVSGVIREGKSVNLGCVLTFQDITREYFVERTKREFVSIAAHQLRTPLTGMSWTVEALLSGARGALNAAQKELVEKGLDAIHRMVELVNDLLDVSRIEEGRFGIKSQTQPIAPLIERVMGNLQKQAVKKKITLSAQVEEGIPELPFDTDKMEFVLNNIIDNAIKYTPAGGSVWLEVKHDAKDLLMSVKDTGIGIPASECDRVFTKFFRSRKAVSYHTDGSGLGLYVAKNIVEQHGGRIWFTTKEDEGTTFFIQLPLVKI